MSNLKEKKQQITRYLNHMGKNAFHVFLFTTYKMSSLTKIEKIYEYLGKLLEVGKTRKDKWKSREI